MFVTLFVVFFSHTVFASDFSLKQFPQQMAEPSNTASLTDLSILQTTNSIVT